jgi:hypothetical protein
MLDIRHREQHHGISWSVNFTDNAREITDDFQRLASPLIILDQTDDETGKIDAARDQRAESGEYRDVALQELEPTSAFNHHRVRLLELDQSREHLVKQVLAMEDCREQPHSASLQAPQLADERCSVNGFNQGFQGDASAGEPGQTSESREVIGGGIGVT